MNQYETNYDQLTKLLGDKDYQRIENEPFMPLVVEKLGEEPLVSLCHYGTMHGDPCRDPEVVFLIQDKTAKPVYYRNDYVAVEHATIEDHFGDVPVRPHLQKSLDSFCQMWWSNIKEQGFFEAAKKLAAKQSIEDCLPTSKPNTEPDCGPDMDP